MDKDFAPQPDLSDSAKAEIIAESKARYRLAIALDPELKGCRDDWGPAPNSILMSRAAEAIEAWNTRQPVTIQAKDETVLALIDGLIASSVELRQRVTSPKRTKYLLGRIEAMKDLKADIRALAAPGKGAE